MIAKRQAYEFLESLKARLEQELPSPVKMQHHVDEIVKTAHNDPSKKHLAGREHAFINAIATPILFKALCDYPAMTPELAKEAFLSESFRNLPEYSCASPARRLRHPFNKALNTDAATIYQQWCGESQSQPLTQSCPDFAFRSPFPHRIVFEAKYFLQGSRAKAQRELVENAYQAFFYRALPPDHAETSRPDWDYEYSCLFAYDASPEGLLLDAWRQLAPEVKHGFWEGANVYIMVLRGTQI